MKKRAAVWLSIAAAMVMGAAMAGSTRAGAQAQTNATPAKPPAPPTPRSSDGKPDFSGFFQAPVGATRLPFLQLFSDNKMSPLKQGGEPLYEKHNGDPLHDEPRDFCYPSGFPWGFLESFPVQIVQNSKYLVMIHEFQRMTRIIPLDGRAHSANAEPSYQGDSVGHWEGDVLVIDTVGFKRWFLDGYHYADMTQNRMHSDALHTIERMRRPDLNTIIWQITIDDPKVFTAPWTEAFVMPFHPEWEKDGLFEYVCQDNNRCQGGKCK